MSYCHINTKNNIIPPGAVYMLIYFFPCLPVDYISLPVESLCVFRDHELFIGFGNELSYCQINIKKIITPPVAVYLL